MNLKIGLSTIKAKNQKEFEAGMCSIPIKRNHDRFNLQY